MKNNKILTKVVGLITLLSMTVGLTACSSPTNISTNPIGKAKAASNLNQNSSASVNQSSSMPNPQTRVS